MEQLINKEKQYMTIEKAQELQQITLHCLMTNFLSVTLNDKLERTNAYKHKLKSITKQQQSELCRIVDEDLGLIWGMGGDYADKCMYAAMRGQENFIKEVADIGYGDYPILAQMLKMYKEDKDAVLCALNINVIEAPIK